MHGIRLVDDDVMPEGHDFILVEVSDGGLIFYRRSALTAATLEDSWAAYRALCDHPSPQPGLRSVS